MRIIVPPIPAFLCITTMVILRWLLPVTIPIGWPWNLIGIVPVIIGLAIGFSGICQFRKAETNIRPFREADKMVTSGPFRFTCKCTDYEMSLPGSMLCLNSHGIFDDRRIVMVPPPLQHAQRYRASAKRSPATDRNSLTT